MKGYLKKIEEEASPIEMVIAKQREKESEYQMVQVTRNTWIVVPKGKGTPEYVERYRREKMGVRLYDETERKQ